MECIAAARRHIIAAKELGEDRQMRGSRRQALPRLVIESYREVLVTAKLWEHAHPDASA